MTKIMQLITLSGQIFEVGENEITSIQRRQLGQGVGEHFEAIGPVTPRQGDRDLVEVSWIIPMTAVASLKVVKFQ